MTDDPQIEFSYAHSRDGTRLRIARSRHAGDIAGAVILLQGQGEFIEKYLETMTFLCRAGYAVYSLDWRGQGRSARALGNSQKGYVRSYAEYLGDLQTLVDIVATGHARDETFVLAHSMGAHIALRYLCRYPDAFAAAALCAPMFGVRFSRRQRLLATLISGAAALVGSGALYAPGRSNYRREARPFEGNYQTTDRDRYERMHDQIARDPLLAIGGPTLGWLHAMTRSVRALRNDMKRSPPRTPTLILSAGDERVVDNAAHLEFAKRLPRGRLVTFPEARHEILQERDDIYLEALSTVVEFFALYHHQSTGEQQAPRPAIHTEPA